MRVLPYPVKKKLLRIAAVRPEMTIRERYQRMVLNPRIVMEIEPPQHALHPDVDGKSLRAAIGEKQNAVRDLFAHAPDADQMLARFVRRQLGDLLQRNFARGDLPCRDEEMPRAKSKPALAQLRLGRQREARRIRERVQAFADLV